MLPVNTFFCSLEFKLSCAPGGSRRGRYPLPGTVTEPSHCVYSPLHILLSASPLHLQSPHLSSFCLCIWSSWSRLKLSVRSVFWGCPLLLRCLEPLQRASGTQTAELSWEPWVEGWNIRSRQSEGTNMEEWWWQWMEC